MAELMGLKSWAEVLWKNDSPTGPQALGRNGTMQCLGINVFADRGMVRLRPVNTKGWANSCFIEVPIGKIDSVIAALKEAKKHGGG